MPNYDWETPEDFFASLDSEFHFTLDVCADIVNTKCVRYIVKDSLRKDWSGNVCWMNPPYDKSIGDWVRKAWETAQHGGTVVALLQGRGCDTKWWHSYVMKASEIRFVRDRLHFGRNGIWSRANISSVIVVFSPYCQGPPRISSISNKGERI